MTDEHLQAPPTQTLIDIGLKDELTFDTFVLSGNEQLFQMLVELKPSDEFQYLNWWGGAALGKTHLLQSVCHAWSKAGLSTIYVSSKDLLMMIGNADTAEVLRGFESLDLVAVDDVDCLSNSPELQVALFHLYNRMLSKARTLLVASSVLPRDIPFELQDLKSRLTSGFNIQLCDVNDDVKKQILSVRAAMRGIKLSDEVLDFLMARTTRDMKSLMLMLDAVDVDSLRQKRRVTIPFLKTVLSKLNVQA